MARRPTRPLERPSPNQNDRPPGAPVDHLILHYTGMRTAGDALERLTDPRSEVSAHYLIDEDGAVLRLVPEHRRAWHAGQSFWRGANGLNARSIGIELVNPGHEWGYRAFPERQIVALTALARDILGRWPIPAHNVVGHSDVAPRRKQDPGELFDWRRLAEEGVGLWPAPSPSCDSPESIAELLAGVGYEIVDPAATLRAFQRRFRPTRIDGVGDVETARLALGLFDLVGAPSSDTR